jgi:hypothetical protein
MGASPFTQTGVGAGRPRDTYGQQVYREKWFDGTYLYYPGSGAAGRNIKAFERIMDAEEDYPWNVSQDAGRLERVGQVGMHGGKLAFYRLTDKGDYIMPPDALNPILAAAVQGQSDLTIEGLVHSHWRNPGGELVCITHWNFPGGAVLSAVDLMALVADPSGEAAQETLKDVRRKITETP